MSKENCLELYVVGDEWMLFDEKEHPQNTQFSDCRRNVIRNLK
jgi:hypothetical protein